MLELQPMLDRTALQPDHVRPLTVGVDGVLRPIALPGVELRVADVPWNPKRA
jgi:hypothetical protein